MNNENLENNEQIQHKPVKHIKDKRHYNRFRDRKDKKLYEVEIDEFEEYNEGD